MDSKFHKIAMPFEAVGPDGFIYLTFPDNGAGTGYAAFIRHLQQLAELDPIQIADLLGTPTGAALFGKVEVLRGAPTGKELLERFEDQVEAVAGPLNRDEYARFLSGESPGSLPTIRLKEASTKIRLGRLMLWPWSKKK